MRLLFYKNDEGKELKKSFCNFEENYGESGAYKGTLYFEKMRFLNDSETKESQPERILSEDEMEIYDPSQDEETEEENNLISDIQTGNWFWHFVGCASEELGALYEQKADGVLGLLSQYEPFDYDKALKPSSLPVSVTEADDFDDRDDESESDSEEIATAESGDDWRILDGDAFEALTKKIKSELSMWVKSFRKMEIEKREYYETDKVPSLINNLYSQKLLEERKFSLCLGYSSGFLNMGYWNDRPLRIMNYRHIENELKKSTGAGEDRRILKSKNEHKIKSPRKLNLKDLELIRKKENQFFANFYKNKRNLEIVNETDGEIHYNEDQEKIAEMEAIQKIEDTAIKTMEELARVPIIHDKIQHIQLFWDKDSFNYKGKEDLQIFLD